MNGGNPAGMPCVPRFEQSMSFGAADFTDNDSGWLEAHAGAKTIEHCHVAGRSKIDVILEAALKLRRVLNGNNAVVRRQPDHGIEASVEEGRFPGPLRADDENVPLGCNSLPDDVSVTQTANRVQKGLSSAEFVQRIVLVGEDALRFVLLEWEDLSRTKTDREDRPAHDRRDDSFEAAAIQRQLCFQNGTFMVEARPAPGCDCIERPGGLAGRHFTHRHKRFAYPLYPH